MDAQWVLVICVIALLLGLYRMSRRIDQKIAQALEQKPTNQVIPAASKAELGDDSFWKWFQSSKVASIVVRRQVILSVNPAAEQLLGRSLSDLKDRPAMAFMTQSSAAFAQKVGIEPELSEREYEIVKPDGEVITIVTQPSMLSLSGENTRVLMIFDVSEQRRREAILRDSEKTLESELSEKSASLGEAQTYLNLALEHFSEGYILVDPSQMIRFLNRRVRAIFPEVAQMLRPQMDWIRVIDAMLDQGLILAPSGADKAIVKTWFEQGSLAGFTQQDLELNGHRWVRVTIKSLPAGDQIITVVDISELKAAIENAEIAASSKSNFLASMSHEIRTPMNGILGMVDLMKRSPLSEDQKEMVATIQDSGKALLSLINDILDISKIEAGRLDLHRNKVDMLAMIEQLMYMFQIQAQSKNISLNFSHQERLPETVFADGKRLRQVMINLISNAIKFTPEGSVSVDLKYRNQVAYFSVTDTGVGIEDEDISRISEAFVRIANPMHQVAGSGLGLAITQALVHRMGGDLSIESRFGEGSTFTVSLMLPSSREVTHQPIVADRVIGYHGETLSLMVVDDDAVQRRLLIDTLTPLGFNIIAAADGASCLQMLEQCTPKLFMLDISMPNMTGWELAAELRQRGLNVPIVMISAEADEGLGLGGGRHDEEDAPLHNDYLVKPINMPSLLTTLADQLNITLQLAGDSTPEDATSELKSGLKNDPLIIKELLYFIDIGYVDGFKNALLKAETGDRLNPQLCADLHRNLAQLDLTKIHSQLMTINNEN